MLNYKPRPLNCCEARRRPKTNMVKGLIRRNARPWPRPKVMTERRNAMWHVSFNCDDLSAALKEQMEKEAQLNQEIKDQLSNIGIQL